MHQLTAGFTDLLAIWTRIKGVCEHIRPAPAPDFVDRIGFGRIVLGDGDGERSCTSLAEAIQYVLSRRTGWIAVRGGNGAGKSTLLAALKAHLRGRAYYWPNHDRLSFRFNTTLLAASDQASATAIDVDAEGEDATEGKSGYSSGERQLQVLREIAANTDHAIYLLDEWDANLDAENRSAARAIVDVLAQRALVVEISHRDEPGASV
jgi:ABC-type molybdenum transport system ATPase subunit/photorepair protein PhrA